MYFSIKAKAMKVYRYVFEYIKAHNFGFIKSNVMNVYDSAIATCNLPILKELIGYKDPNVALMTYRCCLNIFLNDDVDMFNFLVDHDQKLDEHNREQNQRMVNAVNHDESHNLPIAITHDFVIQTCRTAVVYRSYNIFGRIFELFGYMLSIRDLHSILVHILIFVPKDVDEYDLRNTDFDIKVERFSYSWGRDEIETIIVKRRDNTLLLRYLDEYDIKMDNSGLSLDICYDTKKQTQYRNNATLPTSLRILARFMKYIREYIGMEFWTPTVFTNTNMDQYILIYLLDQLRRNVIHIAYSLTFDNKPSAIITETLLAQARQFGVVKMNTLNPLCFLQLHSIILHMLHEWSVENVGYVIREYMSIPSAIDIILKMLPRMPNWIYATDPYFVLPHSLQTKYYDTTRVLIGHKLRLSDIENLLFTLTSKCYIKSTLIPIYDNDIQHMLGMQDLYNYNQYITDLRVKYHMLLARMTKRGIDRDVVTHVFSFV
jgi:hypothetical protein